MSVMEVRNGEEAQLAAETAEMREKLLKLTQRLDHMVPDPKGG